MKKILIFTLVLLVISFVACKENTTNIKAIKGEIELISPQQVYDAIYKDRSIQLIDVRTPEEFEGNHLKGAQNICVTSDDFKEKAEIFHDMVMVKGSDTCREKGNRLFKEKKVGLQSYAKGSH